MADVDLGSLDLCDLDLFEDGFPHAAFDTLRREAPVWWHPRTPRTPDDVGFWVVSTHAETLDVFLDPEAYSSEGGGARRRGGTFLQDMPMAGAILNMMDDPRHQRIRQLVNRGFAPRHIGALEPDLRRRAREIVAGVADPQRCDFVLEVARDLPLQAICMLLGVPQEDRDTLCDWIDTGFEHTNRELGQASEAASQATANLARYASELVAKKRAQPADDVLSVVIHSELEDQEPSRLTDGELTNFFILLFTAGSETTRKAISGGMLELLRDPQQLEWLRTRPSVPIAAVEEIVRFTTPSVYKRRTATRDTKLGGQSIAAGDKVTVWEMSANRDAAVFDEPHRFDLGRDPNPHVGFGRGPHFCLGANLARLEIKVLLEEFLASAHDIELAGSPVYTRDNRLFGLRSLPIRFERC
jgi:cytochrome P450